MSVTSSAAHAHRPTCHLPTCHLRRQGRCARSEQPTPAEKPPYRHSPKLGLNSGRELTVQELSLYRPAPFRTPAERAWIRWTWWAPRGIRRDGSPVGGMREGDQGRRERPILLKSSRQRNFYRGAIYIYNQSTENPWVGSLRQPRGQRVSFRPACNGG